MAKLESEKKTPSLASSALDNLPIDALTRRREFVDYLDQLEIDKKEAANDYAAHEKRLTDVFNVSKFVQSTVKKLRKMESNVRAREIRQLVFFIRDLELADPQLNLFNDDGQPGGLPREKDEATVFDKSGNKAAPKASAGEAPKKLTGAEPPKHVPSPAIPLDEARKKFEEANAKGKAARGEKTPVPPTAAATAAESGAAGGEAKTAPTPKPPGSPKKTAATPLPPSTTSRSAEATAKASSRRMSRSPTREEAKAIADKYFDKPKPSDDGEADENPGTYQVH